MGEGGGGDRPPSRRMQADRPLAMAIAHKPVYTPIKLRTLALPYAKNTIETDVSTHSTGYKLNVKSANVSCLFFSPFPSLPTAKHKLPQPGPGWSPLPTAVAFCCIVCLQNASGCSIPGSLVSIAMSGKIKANPGSGQAS